MENSWVSIKRRFLSPGQNGEGQDDGSEAHSGDSVTPENGTALSSSGSPLPPPAAPPSSAAPPAAENVPVTGQMLDATGRQSEMIRVGMGQVLERLDELARLKEDFNALIIDPISSLIADYPTVQSKLMETEERLKQEHEAGAIIRRDMRELVVAHEKLSDDFAVVSSQYQHSTRVLREQETESEGLSVALKEQEGRVADLERQLTTERQRIRVISEELVAVRRQAQEADAAVSRLERDLAEARDSMEILEFDNQALRASSSDQSQRLAALDTRYNDLEQQLHAAQEQAADFQTKLDAEHGLRKKLEAQLDAERTSARVEIAALEMKVEGTTSRMGVTEKILSHAREQLREKTDELKAAERTTKEALIEKNTLEHRLEAAQQELERQTALANESQEARAELSERAEMLTKAIAAKESLLQRSDHRTGMLLDRIDQLTRKFEDERNGLEAKNKKLWEDLQREKSERALAQGALETARRTRIEVEREIARLQRSRRTGATQESETVSAVVAPPEPPVEAAEPPTNVRPFKAPEAEESRSA
jgi:crescentin